MFGKRLKEIRKKRNYTLEVLANRYNKKFDAKLNKGTLSMYENGKQEPLMSVVKNLAIVLGCSVDYLIGKTEIEEEAPVTDTQLKFALFNGSDGITDEMLEKVKEYAEFVMQKSK